MGGCRTIVPRSACLKVKLVDIVLRENGRRAEQDLAAVNDFEFTELTAFNLGITRFEFSINHSAHHVGRGVTEIDWVPKHIALNGAVLDKRFHLVRSRLAYHCD